MAGLAQSVERLIAEWEVAGLRPRKMAVPSPVGDEKECPQLALLTLKLIMLA